MKTVVTKSMRLVFISDIKKSSLFLFYSFFFFLVFCQVLFNCFEKKTENNLSDKVFLLVFSTDFFHCLAKDPSLAMSNSS